MTIWLRSLTERNVIDIFKSLDCAVNGRCMMCCFQYHAGHTRKASRISKAAVDNCGKGVGNFYLS